MEKRRIKFNRWSVWTFVVVNLLFFSVPLYVFAYDEHTTHAALTDEIVDFYNLSFPEKAFTAEEKEWIVQGSIDEDLWPRWTNHFYDPVNNEGWSAEEMGRLSPSLALKLNNYLLSDYPPITSKSWAQSPDRQAQYKQFGGNRTWQRAIYELAENDSKKEAYYTLGHILHLLEDSSVPDHTRNDTHAHPLHLFTGDYGSPYEEYTERYKRNSNGTTIVVTNAEALHKNGAKPVFRSTLDGYFDAIAGYSNNYFFSKDTVPEVEVASGLVEYKKYKKPLVVSEKDGVGYGFDRNNKEMVLLRVDYQVTSKRKLVRVYNLSPDEKNFFILDSYFSRLSREAIVNGAGMIELFFDEVDKVKKGEKTVADLPKEKAGITSVLSVVTTAKQGYQTVKTSIQDAANKVSKGVENLVGGVKVKLGFVAPKNEPVKETKVVVQTLPSFPPLQGEGVTVPSPSTTKSTVAPKPEVKKEPEKKVVAKPVVPPKAPQQVLGERIVAEVSPPQEVAPVTPIVITPVATPIIQLPVFVPISSGGGSGGGGANPDPVPVAPVAVVAPVSPSTTTATSSSDPTPTSTPTSTPPDPSSLGGSGQQTASSSPSSGVPVVPPVVLDTTPPTAPLLDTLFAQVFYTTTSAVTIFGTNSTDTVKILAYTSADGQAPSPTFSLKGEGALPSPSNWSFDAMLDAGRNQFYFNALDEANNTSSLSVPAVLVLDTDPPPVPTVTVLNQTTVSSTNIHVSISGVDVLSPVTTYDVEYGSCRDVACNVSTTVWVGLSYNTTTTEFDFTGTRGQSYVFRARAGDGLGNVSDWSIDCRSTVSCAPTDGATFVNWSGELVINEVAWAGTSAQLPNDEWIELYNNTDQPIDFTGWKIVVSGVTMNYSRRNNLIVPPRGYFMLERTRDETVRAVAADIIFTLSGGLNNRGEKLELIKPSGEKADEVDATAGWFAGDTVKYRSMERLETLKSGSDPTNWQNNKSFRLLPRTSNGAELNGSPKQSNFGFFPLAFQQSEQQRVLTPDGNPYLLQYYEIPVGYTLTIEPGVVIKSFLSDAKIDVRGKLVVNGEGEQPVVFTSGRDQSFSNNLWNTVVGSWSGASPAAKDWQGLLFRAGSVGELQGVELRYAGKEFLPPGASIFTPKVSQAIRADSAAISIQNIRFAANGDTTFFLNNASTTIGGSAFVGGDKAVEANGGTLAMSDSSFSNFSNAQGPVQMKTAWPELDNLALSNNTLNLVFLDQVRVREAARLDERTPVYASSVIIDPAATLTLEAGAALYLKEYGFVDVHGSLMALGTVDDPVIISSLVPTSYWSNITFTSSTSLLRNVVVSRGNRLARRPPESDGMLLLNNSTVTMENCTVGDVWDGSIVQSRNSTVTVRNCEIGQSTRPTFTTIGIKATNGGAVHLDTTTFKNLTTGLYAATLPAPQLTVQNMTNADFVGVDTISDPSVWWNGALVPVGGGG